MRKTLIALALAAAALAGGTSASQAGYYHNDGYNYGYSYQPTYYYQPVCRTITFRVWDDYSYTYVYRTKQVCH